MALAKEIDEAIEELPLHEQRYLLVLLVDQAFKGLMPESWEPVRERLVDGGKSKKALDALRQSGAAA
jgi:hypothetical protein